MLAKIKTNNVHTCVINAYCPQSLNTKEEKENHYHELAETYAECRKGNVTIIIGDMNVRLQARAEGEERIIGEHVFGKGSDSLDSQAVKTAENRELFMNGPYEFRVVESSHPDPLQYLSTFWERRLTEYVHEDHRAVDRQGLSENEIVTPSNYNALIIGAVVIASICGAVYFLKR